MDLQTILDKGATAMDLVFLALTAAFFAASVLLVAGFERLRQPPERTPR
jgi:uncharacterized protein YciW